MNGRDSLLPFVRRRRQRHVVTRDLRRLAADAQDFCHQIERTVASFGTDRIFDERLRKVELLALTLRKRSEEVLSRAD